MIESYFQPQNGTSGRFATDSFFSRNAYLGVATPYGSIRAGRLTTPLYISTINLNPFVSMDKKICAELAQSCKRMAAPYESVPSGAGHDASLFANAGIPSGMLFIRNENGSHNPHEAMDIDDFMLGVRVLADTIEHL